MEAQTQKDLFPVTQPPGCKTRPPLSEDVVISQPFLRDTSSQAEFTSTATVCQHLKNVVPLPARLHRFRREIGCPVNWCSPIQICLVLLSRNFPSIFSFLKFNDDVFLE